MLHRLLYACALLSAISNVVSSAEPAAPNAPRPPIHGILYNEDDSNRFIQDPEGTMEPERLDQMVDELADSQVTVMLICCGHKKTNFKSKVWDVHCEGFDPSKDNDQPYFGDTPKGRRDIFRQWTHNLQLMLHSGIDPNRRMIERCRKRDISPWISIRMNDVHDSEVDRSMLHSRFWMEHPEYWRRSDRCTKWNDRSLNYAMKPVRDHVMALIEEVCGRYDMDGLELDWNRFPSHFREGEEIEQDKVLTEWMAEVRGVVCAAEKKWGHPICLASRVPARPEVSMGIGLDAVAWAKRGLIDHLIVAPFFSTTDFDIPVDQWNDLLEGTGVGVTVGLEERVRPHPDAPLIDNTPEHRRGAAMAALARGSQGIYMFNNFGVPRNMPYLLKEMGSVNSLADKDRTYTVTYVDINIPGKSIPPALPKKLEAGKAAEFSLFIGPKPLSSARGEVQLTLVPEKPDEKCTVRVTLNGYPSAAGANFAFTSEVFRKGYNTIRVVNAGTSPITIQSIELSLRFPSGGKK